MTFLHVLHDGMLDIHDNTQATYLTSHGYGMSKIEGNYT